MNVLELPAVKGGNAVNTVEVGEHLKVVGDQEFTPAGHTTWRVLTPRDGDTRLTWDPENPGDCRDAEQLFKQLAKGGLTAYLCDDRGKPTKRIMKEFDRTAGQVVFAPKDLTAGG